ncbi:gliding-associated putative ABC transporter substrate-binding component GldG [Larkinella arboricola]|uniref:Gliding-associated putative ABC transporter substrate-binding component GldG n=1 Tax=Larkinella arboricola TaxID=643671 RepID=A0A327XDQ1_LARAB|nr:gliding motility-associated ABC transporter substrate-binding protein GldG [Larkinella arboricola]RAK02376.1 gliding-associated putative ABC transporter substrate-binding component GldG [Larkinella arboricola]
MKSFLVRFGIVLAVVVVVNLLSSFLFFRVDLTQEGRYTLSEATENLLANLDDDVHVNVYLTGNLPPGFKRLETSIRETLAEFQARAGQTLTYRFIDPTANPNEKQRTEFQTQLLQKGLTPTNLNFRNEGNQRTEQLIYPWAIVSYKGRELPVLLLRGNRSSSPEEQLNQSIENVEYELASAIRRLTVREKKVLGVAVSYTDIEPLRMSDLLATLQEFYDIKLIDLQASRDLVGLDGLIVPKPDRPFTEADKYKIDQFVVNGGRALFFVDGLQIDSIGREGTYAQPLNLNLNDLFFRWGVRVNNDIIKDLSCAFIPLNVGNMGDKPNVQLLPWRFFPLINNFGRSPIVRNLDAIYSRFTSTLDTVQAPGIAKTPLLMSSQYTKILKAPALVSYNEARQQPDPRTYDSGVQLIACLLEGRFQSLYTNRILPGDPRAASFKAQGQPAKIVVCSDGDLLINDINYQTNTPYPLGYERFSKNTFANKDFVVNAVNYLLDDNGIIAARTRQVTLRPLDKIRLREDRLSWQLLNLLGPVVLIGLVGVTWQFARRRKYA